MVSLEEVLPGILIGGAVALGAAVLTGQASGSQVKDNARRLVLEINQQLPQERQGGGDEQPHQGGMNGGGGGSMNGGGGRGQTGPTAGEFGIAGSQPATVPTTGGGRKRAQAATPSDVAVQTEESATGVEVQTMESAEATALSAVRGSGFQGDFI